ncbi:DNA-3-methyladenine glycosylase 2 family protein [Curvibacter gracilis]|uniref:DNA-3-methyladenine glycosylase 2 family protein n=1 Tax=Curvibacter gracilis TaxID=230310 RepID=UPI0004818858|nr:Ada metal-binding domain-containing protein [Curvibacter gracilis]
MPSPSTPAKGLSAVHAHPGPPAGLQGLSADPEACYLALSTRDARFDGHFFTGVTSTGIYCRPVCTVRAPKRENCRFFELAAQAEQAGFRPCLRCRPELAPQTLAWSSTDARRILAAEAARWLDDPRHWPHAGERDADPVMTRLADHLGVSDRHLRRIFEASLGVAPLRYLQTRRLLAAKQLLTDTALPVTEVAQASGFASLRRFNAAFVEHYGLNPSQWRKSPGVAGQAQAAIRLAYRPPYDQDGLARFLAQRALQGLETVTPGSDGLRVARTLRLPPLPGGTAPLLGWVQVHWPTQVQQVLLRCSESLSPALPTLIRRVRQWLDLDADPGAIDQVLAPHFGSLNGLRVPGTLDGFELAVRAILGQQVTVAGGRTLCQRLVDRLGPALPTDADTPTGLNRLFPDAATLAALDDGQGLAPCLGELGIVRQRQRALLALAQAVHTGRLALDGGAPLAQTLAGLTALPGVGDWTAQYIALRALRWPDAFPAGDGVLQDRLGTRPPGSTPRQRLLATEAASAAWKPWRGYAVLRIWEHGPPSAVGSD